MSFHKGPSNQKCLDFDFHESYNLQIFSCRPSSGSSSRSGSSDWDSMDELENYTLKTFRRPLRPAAAHKKSQFKFRKSENSSTEIDNSVNENANKDTEQKELHPDIVVQDAADTHKETVVKEKSKNGSASVISPMSASSPSMSSVYLRKHRDQIQEIRQPTGFDSSLAAQVVARAQNFGKKFNFLQKEEVFGSD